MEENSSEKITKKLKIMFENHTANLFLFTSNRNIEEAMAFKKETSASIDSQHKNDKSNSRVVTFDDFWVLTGQEKGREAIWC